ncbi:MAG: DUF3261 domain-containing protein [Puniceicoccales bacterium]|nr:DUF3261 domain-containing protein [Puniceicoccales bacterium]
MPMPTYLKHSIFSRERDGRHGGRPDLALTPALAPALTRTPARTPALTLALAVLWLVLPLLAGCANPPLEPIVTLSPNITVRLPRPPAPDTPPVHREQLLTATAHGKTHTLYVVLDISGGKVRLAGLSPLGIRLFTGTYDGETIAVEQIPVAAELPPAAQVLGDIMLASCSLAEWAAVLPAGWVLADAPDGLRRVLKNPEGTVITEIFYTQTQGLREPSGLRNHRFAYEIKITNLADTDADDAANPADTANSAPADAAAR